MFTTLRCFGKILATSDWKPNAKANTSSQKRNVTTNTFGFKLTLARTCMIGERLGRNIRNKGTIKLFIVDIQFRCSSQPVFELEQNKATQFF